MFIERKSQSHEMRGTPDSSQVQLCPDHGETYAGSIHSEQEGSSAIRVSGRVHICFTPRGHEETTFGSPTSSNILLVQIHSETVLY